jgi:HK97 family phage portal protein
MEYTRQLLSTSGHLKATVAIPGWAQEMIDHPEGRGNAVDAFAKVPQLYRAVMLRAQALACVPFIVRKGEKLVSWPFPQTLGKLLGEMEASLMVAGGAYVLKMQPASGGTRTVGLQFLSPTTMTAKYEPHDRRVSYTQRIGAMQYGPWDSERMLFIREFSFKTEVGNGLAPAQVALPAANLRISMQEFASGFFSSGGQPMTLLTVAGNPAPAEMDRTERFFKRTMTGVRNAWRVLALRSEVTVQAITPAINTMAMPEMHETTTREIAAAFGIPLSLLTSDSANYATAQSDMRLFYENTIKARLMMYEAAINEQVLGEMGLEIKFTPEALAIYQEDEAERSGSLLNLVNAGMPLTNAMLILGYAVEDVTGLDAMVETVTTSGAVIAVEAAPKALQMPTEPPMEDEPSDADDEFEFDEYGVQAHQKRMAEELRVWAKLAIKSASRAVDFGCDHIVPELESWIKAQLAAPDADVAQVFEHVHIKELRLTTKAEKKIAAAVNAVFKKFGGRIKSQAANGVVDYTGTEQMFDALSKKLAPILEGVYTVQIKADVEPSGVDVDPERFTTAAFNYAEREAGTTLRLEMNKTTLDNLRRVSAKLGLDPSLSAAEITAALYPTFSPYRAAMTAVTEVTRAKAAATNGAYDILTEYGENPVRRWSTRVDERVCPICGPLDNKKEKIYIKQFSEGPPAHPNCRCRIGFEESADTDDVGVFD